MRVLLLLFFLGVVGSIEANEASSVPVGDFDHSGQSPAADPAVSSGIKSPREEEPGVGEQFLLEKPILNSPPVFDAESRLRKFAGHGPNHYPSLWTYSSEVIAFPSDPKDFLNESARTPAEDFDWTRGSVVTPAVALIDGGSGYLWKVLVINPIDPRGEDPGFTLSFRVHDREEFKAAVHFLRNKLPAFDIPKGDVSFHLFEPIGPEAPDSNRLSLNAKFDGDGEIEILEEPREGSSRSLRDFFSRSAVPDSDPRFATFPLDGGAILMARVSYSRHISLASGGTSSDGNGWRDQRSRLAEFRAKYLRILFHSLSHTGLFFAYRGAITHFLNFGGDLAADQRSLDYVESDGSLRRLDVYQTSRYNWNQRDHLISLPDQASQNKYQSFLLLGIGQLNGHPRQVIIDIIPKKSLSVHIRVVNSDSYDIARINEDTLAIMKSLQSMGKIDLSVQVNTEDSRVWHETGAHLRKSGERFISIKIKLDSLLQSANNLFVDGDRILADWLMQLAHRDEIKLKILDPKLITFHADEISAWMETAAPRHSLIAPCIRAIRGAQ